MMAGFERRTIPRWAARPATMYDEVERKTVLIQIASEILDLAARIVDELLAEAANPMLTPYERRGLVAIALQVDRQAALRTGTSPNTVEIAARGRAALECGATS